MGHFCFLLPPLPMPSCRPKMRVALDTSTKWWRDSMEEVAAAFTLHFTLYTCLFLPCNVDFFFPLSVPNVYPVDLFEHIWAVDRLQRLGISRYFEPELKECINYVARFDITHTYIYISLKSHTHNIYMIGNGLSLNTLNFRYWKENGICWARVSEVNDIDDTAMGFRLLRLYGHEISAGKKFGLRMIFSWDRV